MLCFYTNLHSIFYEVYLHLDGGSNNEEMEQTQENTIKIDTGEKLIAHAWHKMAGK